MFFDVPGYRIVETLFNGEHTVVQRAVQNIDGKPVILKQLASSFPDSGELARFSFGYEVLSKFDHPNIVKPVAWLGAYSKSRGSPVSTMVLEDQHGIDLFNYLKTFPMGYLSVETFLDIAIQLAEALSVIHYHQVIHKDLHPGNILVNPDTGLVQITDFGLASLLSREQPTLVIPERIEGVLAYISPEQTGRMNRALDYRTDFYTLGITFYQLLTGHTPFKANDALGMVHAHMAIQQQAIKTLREDVPPILSDIIDKLLNKTAEERYQSALGLRKDLEKIRNAVSTNKPVPEFPLGMDDISDRFQIPQKLYGREVEVDLLMQRFFSAAGGKRQMLAIAGYSGIGKSALVHEVHKPIAAYNGLFCSGKFDQFQKNVPYSALQTALKTWLQHVLSLPQNRVVILRERLLNSLGANARVLIDFMPAFEAVLGVLEEVAKLGADETQNRFHLVFQKFVQTIGWEHPLVLFIDDLQWADRGTLNLLTQLMQVDDCRLLVIVAYRDNEVDAHHPAIQTLNAIEKSPHSGELKRITLKPLTETQVCDLLQDALHRSRSEVIPLSTLVYTKTAGNPFFTGEFLKMLYAEKLLDFNLRQQRWEWNLQQIKDKAITDNVVDLMLGKMTQLPADTQSLIQLAACVGSRFDLELLARVAEQPFIQMTRTLWPALRDGLLIQDGGDWRLGFVQQDIQHLAIKSREDHVLSQSSPLSPRCRFLHDRMLQAAYESMPLAKRQLTHLRVGRLLLKYYKEQLSDEECFTIVEQLNHAQGLITDAEEKKTLVTLNCRAAAQAWKASVWEAAARFSQIGKNHLPDNSWEINYKETVELYQLSAESEYLCGNVDTSDQIYEELFRHVDDLTFKANICAQRMVHDIGRGNFKNAIEFGQIGLTFLNLEIPTQDNILIAIDTEKAGLVAHSSNGLIEVKKLPEMKDEKLLIALRIYTNIVTSASLIGERPLRDYSIIKGCNLILASGISDLAAIHLTFYGMYLRQNWDLELAFKQGEQARTLTERYNPCREIANCLNVLGSIIWYLKAPYKEAIELNRLSTSYGFENGEIARAVISQCIALTTESSMGEKLQNLLQQTDNALEIVKKRAIFFPAIRALNLYAKALLSGTSQCKNILEENLFDAETQKKVNMSSHFFLITHYKSLLAFWYGDEKSALDYALKAQTRSESMAPQSYSVDHLFFLGLLLLRHNSTNNKEPIYEKTELQLKMLSDVCESNFSHKYLLILAEKSRNSGANTDDTSALYQLAIKSAQEQGFIHFMALGFELFAEFWVGKKNNFLAEPLLQKALVLYREWGCTARINYINEKYSDLLESEASLTNSGNSLNVSPGSESKNSLDMASVMKSAQLISSELHLKQLSTKVLEVIKECAGASSAILIMKRNDKYGIEASVAEGKPVLAYEEPQPLETESIPTSIVRYVLQSKETISTGAGINGSAFANDPYVATHKPGSILCLPVTYRDKLIGALYLENRLNRNTFTPDRLDVIHLLLAQTAISFENAQLFDQVSQLNENLEQKVRQRTQDLHKAIAELELANQELNAFSYSVSHDLRAPLRIINGYSDIIIGDSTQELSETSKNLMQRIKKNSNRMKDLIDGLLELSRIQRKELIIEKVDLSALVRANFDEMGERHPTQVIRVELAENCKVLGDARILQSVVENLANNAWKYSSKKAIATVTFGRTDPTPQVLSGVGNVPDSIPDNYGVFFIRDTGDGFNMSNAQNLFGNFQRLHSDKQFEGNGIGLATVKRAIEKHGGQVWAHAIEGEGATFFFTLKMDNTDLNQTSQRV